MAHGKRDPGARRLSNRKTHLRIKYGLSVEDFSSMLHAQGGRCAICADTLTPIPSGAHIDHDHGSDVIRGLLCGSCNRGLGLFADDPERLRAAATYVENARGHVAMRVVHAA